MNNGLRRLTGPLGRTLNWCLGVAPKGPPRLPAANEAGPLIASPDECDGRLLPHDTLCVQDVSGSMSWTDCVPSRLEASRKAAEAYIRRRAALSPGDRVGVVTFNNYGRVVLPLTEVTRMDAILLCLSSLRAAGGTDIAAGLKAANSLFAQDVALYPTLARYRRILLLTDGHGGDPLPWATHLKNACVLLDVVGVAQKNEDVDEKLLRRVATTDANGFVHYRFFRDTDSLVAHYENLASGLIYRGHGT